jgi:hypothetical protein
MKANLKREHLRDFLLASLLLAVYTCSFAQSVQKDLETGLTTMGMGLSSDHVYLSDGEEIIKRNTFIYGETYYVNFDGMYGFEREDGHAFPDMQLLVVGEEGDTALHYTDMYADYEAGIEDDPLELYAEITVANPMHSGKNYTLILNISDKRGEGTFKASLDFSIARDDKIQLAYEKFRFREIYLFSLESGQTITDGKASFDETIYFLFEGLEGFALDDGRIQLGLSMVVKDANGNIILDEPDLFGDGYQKYEDVHQQVASSLVLTGSEIANPVLYEVRIWDKRGPAWLSASTKLVVE